MIYTPQTKMALKLCFEVHKDQKDKTDIPYVFHPFHLAEQMKDEITVTTALLHDVVEDSDISFEELKLMGFSNEVLDALRLLTHEPDIPYFEYIEAIKTNLVAKTVKLADLRHNSDISRFEAMTEYDVKRNEKYLKAIQILESSSK